MVVTVVNDNGAIRNPAIADVRIPWEAVRPLWHGLYYDGPIEGACVIFGKPCYFHVTDADRRYRMFWAWTYTQDEWAVEQTAYERWRSEVGEHTGYEQVPYPDGRWRRSTKRFDSAAPGMLEHYRANPPVRADHEVIRAREPIGWFSRTPHLVRARSFRYWEARDLDA